MTIDQQATVLFVCTGNICRSAYGHHLLAQELERRAPGRFRIVSAGTQVNPRLTVPEQIHALRGTELPSLAEHSPTPLNERAVQRADLILAATQDHVARILRDTPGALNRTFTMTEFGAAAAALRDGTLPALPDGPTSGTGSAQPLPERVRALARHLARHRPAVRGSLDSIDLPDPYGLEDAAYPEMARVLEPAVDHTAAVLAGLDRSA